MREKAIYGWLDYGWILQTSEIYLSLLKWYKRPICVLKMFIQFLVKQRNFRHQRRFTTLYLPYIYIDVLRHTFIYIGDVSKRKRTFYIDNSKGCIFVGICCFFPWSLIVLNIETSEKVFFILWSDFYVKGIYIRICLYNWMIK